MKFYQYGPYYIQPNDRRRIEKPEVLKFWDDLEEKQEGISGAVGCYIFGVSNRGMKPWYVGMAAKQTFKKECFALHKLNKYNEALSKVKKGKPFLMLLPKTTLKQDRYAKPSANKQLDIEFLEHTLIGIAAVRNKELLNIKNTKLYKEIVVPGLLNTPRHRPYSETQFFTKMMGLD